MKAALVGLGHEVDLQVGGANYRLDMAVLDPRDPSRYLLAVECDGASYHSSYSARSRDRLRQQVLEGLGWSIYRIWSTDWFRNPKGELQRLDDHIKGLVRSYAIFRSSGQTLERLPCLIKAAPTKTCHSARTSTHSPQSISFVMLGRSSHKPSTVSGRQKRPMHLI